ncbi:hypothetical protein AWW66_18195 [Micromonospora rosaria]|uniref:Uncharacterized protein n=1 Tax=Micromonospora rosaria TaxID=47874 RepID=A0A136PQE1_9ACTN|nr:hypothetical protein [Micromonospora rosaria]KXK60567.1 hypothetical protein AWW66_18195 [Micromonospora rosaria]
MRLARGGAEWTASVPSWLHPDARLSNGVRLNNTVRLSTATLVGVLGALSPGTPYRLGPAA